MPYIKRGGNFYESSESVVTSIYTLKKIGTPTVKKYSGTEVKVSWKDIEGQSGYQISRSTSKTGTNVILTCSR